MRINAIPEDLMPRSVAFNAGAHALRGSILSALEGSSAQQPVDVDALYSLDSVKRVQECLMAMLNKGEVQCCQITGSKAERSVWWTAGVIGKIGKIDKPNGGKYSPAPNPVKRVVRRISPRSQKVKDAISGSPGISRPDLIEMLKTKGLDRQEVTVSLTSLIKTGHVRTEGERRAYRFFTGAKS